MVEIRLERRSIRESKRSRVEVDGVCVAKNRIRLVQVFSLYLVNNNTHISWVVEKNRDVIVVELYIGSAFSILLFIVCELF